jgi:hypothetical protein
MSILRFPSTAAFTQSIRMRRSGAPVDTRFLIVEGVSDKKSFQPLLDRSFHYIPARGKDMVLSAFETLVKEGVSDCLFIVDCDGGTDKKWLGRPGLIISNNRDIEADLLFDLGAFNRVSLEYLADYGYSAPECEAMGQRLLEYARDFTANMGILLDAARDCGANTKIFDVVRNTRRRIRVGDLPEAASLLENFIPTTAAELLLIAQDALGWSESQRAQILERIVRGSEKRCRAHQMDQCPRCTPRRFSNGHDLVDVLSIGISQRCGYVVTEAEFARAARLATSPDAIEAWDVAIRVRKWQAAA